MRSFECGCLTDLAETSQFYQNMASYCRACGVHGQDIDEVVQLVAIDCVKLLSNVSPIPGPLVFTILKRRIAKHFAECKRKPKSISKYENENFRLRCVAPIRNPQRSRFMKRLEMLRPRVRELCWEWLIRRATDETLRQQFRITQPALVSLKHRVCRRFGIVRRRASKFKPKAD